MSAEADGAEVQNPEVHNAVTAEDTDDAGNRLLAGCLRLQQNKLKE